MFNSQCKLEESNKIVYSINNRFMSDYALIDHFYLLALFQEETVQQAWKKFL